MNDMTPQIPKSPLLDHCPESLPATWYYDPAHHEFELKKIHARNWIYVGRANDLVPMTVKRIEVAGDNLILVKDQDGVISCFHNTCRHRGAELCAAAETRLKSKLISCPYHEWAYDLKGNLVRVPYATPTPDFKKEDHGLLKVHVKVWNGFVFVCLAAQPPDFERAPDFGVHAFDNWPMTELVTAHTYVEEIACNWKGFWENYNECLHCPGIHPELCDMVPIYRQGVMAANELPDWTPDQASGTDLKSGAFTWSMNGKPCGPEFPNLTPEERARGQTFVTLWPTMYVVAHVDYARAVSLRPLGPERTELRAEWLFPKATLEAPNFDLDNVTKFATTVMRQDAAASAMNQRGLKSSAFKAGRLMPQEFDVYNFQQWVRRQLAEGGSDA
jgi:glycine betaine catabolism A